MLSFELHSRVRDGGPRGKPMTAVGFLCYNMPAERKKMLRVNSKGETRRAHRSRPSRTQGTAFGHVGSV